MPRGVYDRSKQKKSTEKAEKAVEKTVEKVAKGKPGRKPGMLKKASEPVEALSAPATSLIGQGVTTPRESLFELQRASEALVAIRNSVQSNAGVAFSIDQKLEKLAEHIFDSVMPNRAVVVKEESKEEVVEETKAPVAAAPVEFIPPPAPAVTAPLPFNLPPVNG